MNEQRKASENGTAVQIGAQTLAHAHVSMHLYAMLWPAWSRSWHLPIECAWFVIARIFLDQMHVVSQSCMKGTVTVEEKLVSLCFFFILFDICYCHKPMVSGKVYLESTNISCSKLSRCPLGFPIHPNFMIFMVKKKCVPWFEKEPSSLSCTMPHSFSEMTCLATVLAADIRWGSHSPPFFHVFPLFSLCFPHVFPMFSQAAGHHLPAGRQRGGGQRLTAGAPGGAREGQSEGRGAPGTCVRPAVRGGGCGWWWIFGGHPLVIYRDL